MKKALFIALIFFCTCSKEHLEAPAQPKHCETITMLSEKYSLPDTTYIRTDTIDWNGNGEMQRRLCDSTLADFKKNAIDTTIFRLCSVNMLEKRKYIYKK